MTTSKIDLPYILHIRSCIERIEVYAAKGKAAFDNDTMVQDAILRNLQTMAEATQKLSDEFKTQRPEVPWQKLAGFRNILVHNYLGLNLNQVWNVIEKNLPELKREFFK